MTNETIKYRETYGDRARCSDKASNLRKLKEDLTAPLEKRISTIKQAIGNTIKTTSLSESELRLVNFYSANAEPNTRPILEPTDSFIYFWGEETAVRFFAKRQDPLCLAISQYVETYNQNPEMTQHWLYHNKEQRDNLQLNYNAAIERLVFRKMTETEYQGLLSGEMPFTKSSTGKLHYLPKPTGESK